VYKATKVPETELFVLLKCQFSYRQRMLQIVRK